MRFADPLFLLALIPLALALAWDLTRRSRRARMSFPDRRFFPGRGWRAHAAGAAPVLIGFAALLLGVALARPQTGNARTEVKSEGIDIVLALDISGSMRAEDFKPHNRLYVAKQVAKEFVAGRAGDRIGLVVFSGGAYTQCPLTLDYGIVDHLIDEVDFGQVPDGTAIGMALATATNRLRDAHGKSKVVILLTDGQNNAGEIDPVTAAEAARALEVKVYTIGAGRDGPAQIPVDDPVFGQRMVTIDAKVDEDTLKKIAGVTGGRYFRATSAEALEQIYHEIDRMEKTKAETVEYVQYHEVGPLLALLAGIALAGGLLLAETVGSRIP